VTGALRTTDSSPAPLALLTGATGALGPGLARLLVNEGFRVRALVRRAPPPGLLPPGVEVMLGDILDAGRVAAAVHGADYVFHLAAKLHINNPGSALAGEYRAVNVDGTRVVAEAARDAAVRRLVFFSSIAVYGRTTPGQLAHEDSPASADSLYAVTKRDAEELLLAVRRSSDGQPLGVVLRVAAVYGSHVKGNYRQLVRWLRRGVFLPVGSGENRRTLVHELDVANAALLAALHPAAAGRVYNVTDGHVHTFREIVAVICEVLGRKPPSMYVPTPLAQAGARLLDSGLILAKRSRIAGPLVEKLVEDMAVSGGRIQEELGFTPRFSLRSGWQETIPDLIDD
jgi:nucleoside-diphosphate-sugar epimerase